MTDTLGSPEFKPYGVSIEQVGEYRYNISGDVSVIKPFFIRLCEALQYYLSDSEADHFLQNESAHNQYTINTVFRFYYSKRKGVMEVLLNPAVTHPQDIQKYGEQLKTAIDVTKS